MLRKLLAGAAAVLAVAAGAAPAEASPSGVPVFNWTHAQAARAETYWTAARMRAAIAVDGPSDRALPRATGVTRVGKVFYHFGGTFDFSCTGTVVTSRGKSAVLTAAHCLKQRIGGAVVDAANLIVAFVPGYDNGQAPYGRWGVKSWTVPRGWADRMGRLNPDYDYGVFQVGRHNNVPIQDVTGGNPYWTHAAASGHAALVGYPSSANWPVRCGPTKLSRKVVSGHKPEYQFDCDGYTVGVSGSALLIGPGDVMAGEGTVIGVLGGYHQGGDPKVDGNTSFANRLDADFETFWKQNT